MDVLTILFIVFIIYCVRFIIGKIKNPDQPNGEFYLKEYTDTLINKYNKIT
jgi:hypothetical protein